MRRIRISSPFALSLSKGRPFFGVKEKSGDSSGSARTEVAIGQHGFTLVEMLVALSLFAAIAAMGVSLLRSSVDTQEAVQTRLKAMSGMNRIRAVMANDLAQAVQRPTRGAAGAAVAGGRVAQNANSVTSGIWSDGRSQLRAGWTTRWLCAASRISGVTHI
jgi:general secretion pathway protein J